MGRSWGGDPQGRGCHRDVRLDETSFAECHGSWPRGVIPEPWRAGKMPAQSSTSTLRNPTGKGHLRQPGGETEAQGDAEGGLPHRAAPAA